MSLTTKPVVLENVKITLRNFAGKEGLYNREGDRNFAVLLDDDLAEAMAQDGWNVSYFKPKPGEEHRQAFLEVAVNFKTKGRPPRVTLVTSSGRSNLTEDDIEILDWVDIINVDLIIRPYNWNVSGRSGIRAYLQSLYVTIHEDPLELKYAAYEQREE
jgi:hypothetical protein